MAITYTDIRNRKSQEEALDAVNSYLMKRQDARKPEEEEKPVTTVEDLKSFYSQYNIENPEDKAKFDLRIEQFGKLDPKTFAAREALKDITGDIKSYAPKEKKETYNYTEEDLDNALNMYTVGSDAYNKFVKLKNNVIKLGIDTPAGQKRATQAFNVAPSTPPEPKEEKPLTAPYLRRMAKDAKIKAAQDANPKYDFTGDFPVLDDEDNPVKFEITPEVKKAYSNEIKSNIAYNARKAGLEYKGQVVTNPQDIIFTGEQGKNLINSNTFQNFIKNYQKAVTEEQVGQMTTEEKQMYSNTLRQDFYNYVQNMQLEGLTPSRAFEFFIAPEPKQEDFGAKKNIFELFGN